MILGTIIGKMCRWMDRWTDTLYGAYLVARWPDKYQHPKETKR